MKLHHPLVHALDSSALALVAAALLACPASAQTGYTAIDLTPAGSGSAQTAAGGYAAGYAGSVSNAFSGRAVLWTGDGPVDLHPGFLADPGARSQVNGMSAELLVGSGAGAVTGNRNAPLVWRLDTGVATQLSVPFSHFGGQANATDGVQIVGSAVGLNKDGTAIGSTHGLIWNIASGAVVDVGADANVFDVAGGMQVGVVTKRVANAVLWRSSSKATLLHPKTAALSVANGTDGLRQVGYAGFDIRVRQEAAKGNKTRRFNFAHVWTGTAASAVNIHPYLSSADGAPLESSYAMKVKGSYVVGYATVSTGATAIGPARAIVWDAGHQATDLHAFVPAGFVSSVAYGVDENGNVAGVMTRADGSRHAVLWMRNP
jgi:hypothetical protein